MTMKELIQAEIDKIPEQELNNLYQWIKEFGSIHFWKIYKMWENVRRNKKSASSTMSQDIQARIKVCVTELATLLYEDADKSQLTDLESIEKKVRSQILESVSPEIALFLLNKRQGRK